MHSETAAYHRTKKMLARLERTDALTSAQNRFAFDEALQMTWQTWEDDAVPFTFLKMDIDMFKSINDTFGHDAGDEVLHQITDRLHDSIRLQDVVFRLGGIALCAQQVTNCLQLRQSNFRALHLSYDTKKSLVYDVHIRHA